MNFPGVVGGDLDVKAKIDAALRCGVKVDGHAPGLVGGDLKTYIVTGKQVIGRKEKNTLGID